MTDNYVFLAKDLMTDTKETPPTALGVSELIKQEEIESSSTITFNPPVYIQRYNAIRNILNEEWSQKWIKKVVDFGCAEFKLFKYIKELPHIEHIIGVDVDQELITKCKYEARPLNFHYVLGFSHKLSVDLFAGSIAERDERFLDVDAVICIELIEHLHSHVLNEVPTTIFEFIKPKLAVFTTPNADFNLLFNLKTFRHDDHKFEWTREEFQDWCFRIVKKYPQYNVCFKGIGEGPSGTEHLGCCSQMAIFRHIAPDQISKDVKASQPYKLCDSFTYPYKPDTRNTEEKFMDELRYRINRVFINRLFVNEENDLVEIPLEYMWDFMKDVCPTKEKFVELLQEKGYKIEKKCEELLIQVTQSEESESDSEESSCGSLTLSNIQINENMEETWDI